MLPLLFEHLEQKIVYKFDGICDQLSFIQPYLLLGLWRWSQVSIKE